MTYDSTPPYPRDLVGYGRQPPHAQWPGQARIAVQFVLNYEEGGENCVLHGDAGSEQFLSEMFNPPSFPGSAPEHGKHLRIRLARRRLAHPARVREARPAADGVRRRHGAAAQPRADRAPSGNWGTRSPATAGAGSTTRTWTRPPSASTCASAWTSSATLTGERAAGLVHRARQPQHAPPGGRLRRLRIRQRLLRRRPAVLDEGAKERRQRGAAPDRALHAGLPTTCASPLPQGYSHGRPLLHTT